jgi:hypothetical protein
MATDTTYYYTYSGTNTYSGIGSWTYTGDASYETDYDGYIKVDKGSPDKAQFVIFYAVEDKDPMIFCKTQKELDIEMKKLMKRKDVDKASIRVFTLTGGIKKM